MLRSVSTKPVDFQPAVASTVKFTRRIQEKVVNLSLGWMLFGLFLFVVIFHLVLFFVIYPVKELRHVDVVMYPLPLKIHPLPKKPNQRIELFRPEHLLEQMNKSLIKEIEKFLKPPALDPLYFSLEKLPPSRSLDRHRIVKRVQDFFYEDDHPEDKKSGFFIEYDAFDDDSNVLALELGFNWTGILIGADPVYYQELLDFPRRAWTINSCLSTAPKEETVRMLRFKSHDRRSLIASLAPDNVTADISEPFEARCFPLMSIIKATGLELPLTVDFLSLDASGTSLEIVKTIMWDLVKIKVIAVTESIAHEYKTDSLHAILQTRGYINRGLIPGRGRNTLIFTNADFHLKGYRLHLKD